MRVKKNHLSHVIITISWFPSPIGAVYVKVVVHSLSLASFKKKKIIHASFLQYHSDEWSWSLSGDKYRRHRFDGKSSLHYSVVFSVIPCCFKLNFGTELGNCRTKNGWNSLFNSTDSGFRQQQKRSHQLRSWFNICVSRLWGCVVSSSTRRLLKLVIIKMR